MCVGFVKEMVDGIFEFLQRAEYAALEPFLCEVGKEAFNGIEPRGGRRSEVEDEAWMFVDPFDDFRVLVSSIVVDNDMDGLFLWHPGIDGIEEANELLMAMALHALAKDLPLKDIDSRKQGREAMPLVIVGHGAGAAVLHRQSRLGAVQGGDWHTATQMLIFPIDAIGVTADIGRPLESSARVQGFGSRAGQFAVTHNRLWLQL